MIPAMIAMAGGQIYSGLAANAEGKTADNMSRYNAQLSEREAKMTEARTAYQQKQQAEESERRMSTLRMNLGASGAVSTTGAALDIQSKQASEFELENLMQGYQGRQEATALRSEATLQRIQGKAARRSGKNAMIGSFIGAGSSLMAGFGSMGGGNTGIGKGGSAGGTGSASRGWNANNSFGAGLNRNF